MRTNCHLSLDDMLARRDAEWLSLFANGAVELIKRRLLVAIVAWATRFFAFLRLGPSAVGLCQRHDLRLGHDG